MSLQKIILSVAGIALALGVAAPASAQLYTWRDANGLLVVSNTRQADGSAPVRTYTVSQSSAVRTTRYVAPSRGQMYDDIIAEHAGVHGIRTDLVRAVVQVESAFNTYARSPKGALGLMQLMPATLKDYGVRNPFDPAENIRAGVAYLRSLLDRYQDDETLALAAYNAGPDKVQKYGDVPPYRETVSYVNQVKRKYQKSKSAAAAKTAPSAAPKAPASAPASGTSATPPSAPPSPTPKTQDP